MKTNELSGAALDWAVAKAEGVEVTKYADSPSLFYGPGFDKFKPSTNWAQGGPIIEREEISVSYEVSSFVTGPEWAAWTPAASLIRDDAEAFGYGPTPLVAAMRCYVALKLGYEIEIPEGLL